MYKFLGFFLLLRADFNQQIWQLYKLKCCLERRGHQHSQFMGSFPALLAELELIMLFTAGNYPSCISFFLKWQLLYDCVDWSIKI